MVRNNQFSSPGKKATYFTGTPEPATVTATCFSHQQWKNRNLQNGPIPKFIIIKLVPKKGLEPPHPCEYMDLNHARLPIPPLRHLCCARPARRCDGKYTSILKGLWNVSNRDCACPAPACRERGTRFCTKNKYDFKCILP